ncbi:thrombospondin type-1 domain-containing protein 1 [Kryptolebias marmoratus]|uniref:Thrombospondin type 1 domain containing 1 n=1 Tax=Kryptolebias marmoratus TaxID=37003 RepID=A0A3Q2ZDV2_KRYMA|nr:thrombospondin type-1 domain-containing protein 1 [Kryptolebias marmoratus]XP_024862071.1 thrombospondin type-1 domain-containing protein 1 [Kryptolebias marmoratus]XP_024862072.1 thrombospondin type-1 domain-containing protein 1 [Kryptolebias marmoratus]XP_024862073.1 thrombospondin type-1 domain-containing protein 1 [Kryptolebias marmoratus]
MPQAASQLSFLLLLGGYAFAGLSIWPSFHVALSNGSVFVDFSTKSNSSTVSNMTLSLVDMATNTTVLTRTLPRSRPVGRVEFECSCFLYAGTFRFLLRQTSVTAVSQANETDGTHAESSTWWWSSELQVQWPTFHISVERAGNHSGSFQIGISTNEQFQACSSDTNSALFLDVSFMEYNQIGKNTVRAHIRKTIKPLRSQSVELSCAFPFTDKNFIKVALRSPHTAQEVKSSGPLYLSRIFFYKLLVENVNAYKSGCEGSVTVKMIAPPCAHISGKVLLYGDAGVRRGLAAPAGMEFVPEEPSSPPLAFNWLTRGENKTEFNCSLFYPGKNKYCFRFVFNFSRSPSPAQTQCLVVYRNAESWGPWQPWRVCSVSCGEGVRERVRECLLPSGVRGTQCPGMVKEQSLCSLEDCNVLSSPSPSLSPVPAGVQPLDGNMIAVVGIFLCLAVITATVVVTVWKKLCQTPQCSSVHRGSIHSPGGRKLSDEASICGHSLQRPSLCDGHGPSGDTGFQKDRPSIGTQPLSPQALVMPLPQAPERLSPTGQKVLPTIFGYRLAQQQLKEMKKKGLKEATQLYHVSSSPVHDTMVETSASPTTSPVPSPTGFAHSALPVGLQDNVNQDQFCVATPLSELSPQTSKVTSDRLSPRVELVLGPPVSAHSSRRNSNWRDRTADWVEMIERSGLAGLGGGGEDASSGNAYYKNPNFRRTSSFNDTKPQLLSSARSRQFRERSMTQVGSRTLPEGSCWTKRGWERQPHHSYPIPEHGIAEWAKARPQISDQKKPWMETAVPSHNNQLKHTGTNTNGLSASEKRAEADFRRTAERRKVGEPGGAGGESVSGIGGPPAGLPRSHEVNQLSVDRAEQNWNRRGPSPIQRNMLARKLKEAQSCSGVRGRKRSSSFNVSSSEQRRDRCHSLPMSKTYNSAASPYRLSEAEQRMLDLDLSPVFVQEEE